LRLSINNDGPIESNYPLRWKIIKFITLTENRLSDTNVYVAFST